MSRAGCRATNRFANANRRIPKCMRWSAALPWPVDEHQPFSQTSRLVVKLVLQRRLRLSRCQDQRKCDRVVSWCWKVPFVIVRDNRGQLSTIRHGPKLLNGFDIRTARRQVVVPVCRDLVFLYDQPHVRCEIVQRHPSPVSAVQVKLGKFSLSLRQVVRSTGRRERLGRSHQLPP